MKKIVRYFFDRMGWQISRKQSVIPEYGYFRNEMMVKGLERSKKRGIKVNTIIDVGAAEGSWSLSATEFWPDANYVLFEPLEERKATLEKLSQEKANYYFVPKAAGREESKINFYVSGDLDGSGVADGVNGVSNIRSVNVTSIDIEINKLQLKGPYIIKLDTHGFEVPIIEGCTDILKETALFIIESYGFHITKDSLLFWETCRYMEEKGFRLIDIVDVSHRPKDLAFWQCDAFFAPAELGIFNDNSFH